MAQEELGGSLSHSSRSGVAHFTCPTEADTVQQVRRLLSFLPSNNMEDPPRVAPTDDANRDCSALLDIVPEDANRAYDMLEVIHLLVDHADFMEVQENFARNIICGFGRVQGRPVGVVAQQPTYLAGVIDIDASVKAARFIRFCDCFNIPLVTLIDVPGFMPGTAQEYGGIIRHGAKLIYAYAEATVPKISVITRKAYGGAYDVMSSKHLRGDVNLAWPTAEIAVMGADAAVNIVFREAIAKSDDPERTRAELISEYQQKFNNPYVAASRGYLDDVIDPRDTRKKIVSALEMLRNKRDTNPPKKHGNIPL